jgi:hypothetical protein
MKDNFNQHISISCMVGIAVAGVPTPQQIRYLVLQEPSYISSKQTMKLA